jgi:glycosyltransferase involved in cell wall biosynthesis
MYNAMAEASRKKNGGYPSQIRKIYEGINIRFFHPSKSGSAVHIELGIPKNTPLVGMISRLDPWKGPDIFLRAAALVLKKKPAVHFLLCGGEIEGHEGYEAELKALAGSLGITKSVHFTGWRYKTTRMPEVFRALTISVQCPVNPEPYGLVNIEAMASGIPVVATAQAGPLEICVDGETALLVEPKNPQAAAEAILKLLNHPEQAKEMGLKGRKRAETHFDMAHCIKDLEQVYREILNG